MARLLRTVFAVLEYSQIRTPDGDLKGRWRTVADRETRPATVWSRPERGARGPAPERSRTQITTAALAPADAEGLAAVSMRALAQRLGTGPASLYRYVGSRDELLDLMADAVAGELDLSGPPAATGWGNSSASPSSPKPHTSGTRGWPI